MSPGAGLGPGLLKEIEGGEDEERPAKGHYRIKGQKGSFLQDGGDEGMKDIEAKTKARVEAKLLNFERVAYALRVWGRHGPIHDEIRDGAIKRRIAAKDGRVGRPGNEERIAKKNISENGTGRQA